jgi:hypothetical protein
MVEIFSISTAYPGLIRRRILPYCEKAESIPFTNFGGARFHQHEMAMLPVGRKCTFSAGPLAEGPGVRERQRSGLKASGRRRVKK